MIFNSSRQYFQAFARVRLIKDTEEERRKYVSKGSNILSLKVAEICPIFKVWMSCPSILAPANLPCFDSISKNSEPGSGVFKTFAISEALIPAPLQT